jgi:hypothetical protein
MAHLRSALVAIILGSALVSRAAVAQHGASVSLTHTVTVTVPPRVKVQVATAQTAPSAVRVAGQTSSNGLSLSVNATQPWELSIGTAADKSQLQWSRDGRSEFSSVTSRQAVVASGVLSQVPTAATVFVRPVTATSTTMREAEVDDSDAVILTVVAQ